MSEVFWLVLDTGGAFKNQKTAVDIRHPYVFRFRGNRKQAQKSVAPSERQETVTNNVGEQERKSAS